MLGFEWLVQGRKFVLGFGWAYTKGKVYVRFWLA